MLIIVPDTPLAKAFLALTIFHKIDLEPSLYGWVFCWVLFLTEKITKLSNK